jgi:hypothetical protein
MATPGTNDLSGIATELWRIAGSLGGIREGLRLCEYASDDNRRGRRTAEDEDLGWLSSTLRRRTR